MRLSALLPLLAPIVLASSLWAQEPRDAMRGPDRGSQIQVHGIQVLPVPGKPFSGKDNIHWTRTLEDGSTVRTKLLALIARDSQGRIYREHRTFVPENSNQQSIQKDLVIIDPVAKASTVCVMSTRHCVIKAYHGTGSFKEPKDGLFAGGTRYLSRESLGTSTIDDLEVKGTREALYVGVGIEGNSRVMISTTDFWYSPFLQINLSVIRKEPGIGEQTLKIVDLSISEPDPAVFKVPSGFVLQDLRDAPPQETP